VSAGYAVYYGGASGTYDFRFDAGTNTTATITNLDDGLAFYFAVATYDTNEIESMPSNEVCTRPAFNYSTFKDGQLIFSWSAIPGQAYQVQFTTNLNQIEWQPLSSVITATDSSAEFADRPGRDDQRYYRLVTVPATPRPSRRR